MSVNNPTKKFKLEVDAEYSGNKVGTITLVCIAYLYYDGTVRTVDIDAAFFNNNNIVEYVSACHGDIYDEWLEAAEAHIKGQLEEAAPVEHD
jgi:hypothetical protein